MALPLGASRLLRAQAYARYREIARRVVWLGVKLNDALLEAGYSKSVADRGWDYIRNELPGLYKTINAELKNYAKTLDENQLNTIESKILVRNQLVRNVLEGKDKGVNSAKLLAEIDGFKAPDNAVNISFNAIPAAFQAQARSALELEGETASEVLTITETPTSQVTDNTRGSESTSDN